MGTRRIKDLSSTYQSFADTGPTYSYLDLSRARSDESLLWSAGDEAAALVAEIRASLTPSAEDRAFGGHVIKSRSYTDLPSLEDLRACGSSGGLVPLCPKSVSGTPGQYLNQDQQFKHEVLMRDSSSHSYNSLEDLQTDGSSALVPLCPKAVPATPGKYLNRGPRFNQGGVIMRSLGSQSYSSLPSCSNSLEDLHTCESSPQCPNSIPVTHGQNLNQDQHFKQQMLRRNSSSHPYNSLEDLQTDGSSTLVPLCPKTFPVTPGQNLNQDQQFNHQVVMRGSALRSFGSSTPSSEVLTLCPSGEKEYRRVPVTVREEIAPVSHRSYWKTFFKIGGMTARGKATLAIKKVPPPTVPREGSSSSSSVCSSQSCTSSCSSSTSWSASATSSHRHSGSSGVSSADQRGSFASSVGEEGSYDPSPSPHSPARDSGCDHGMVGSGPTAAGNPPTGGNRPATTHTAANSSASPSHYQNNTQFTFPPQGPQFAHLMCPKASPGSPHHTAPEGSYPYQSPLEDQGIDVQSPGRSSPGSGSGSSSSTGSTTSGNCRNSTTSLDSGRASSSTQTHTNRLSGNSYDSTSILRHSYHSSSSSIGSMEQDATLLINVQDLLSNGVPDAEVLRIWLTELHFEEYYEKFLSAGYDLPTISRMTPEDLNAIGITKPAHRKRLKAEISRLNISDGLPDFIPSRLEEWLTLLRLDSYTQSLKQQNYNTVEQVTQITWEDLEDVGITKLGHQKKVMLAIKRVKDILAGKKFVSLPPHTNEGKVLLIPNQDTTPQDVYFTLGELRSYPNENYGSHGLVETELAQQHSRMHSSMYHSSVHPSQMHLRYPGAFQIPDKMPPPPMNPTIHYRPDVVAVNVRNTLKPRGADEPIYGTCQTFLPMQRNSGLPSLPPRPFLPLQNAPHPQRSLDDGDITPTNEISHLYSGGSTLPRPRSANKYRPVAMVTAKTRVDIHETPPQFSKDNNNSNVKAGVGGGGGEKVFPASTNNTPQGTPKKLPPPPPPKRSNSISETPQQAKDGGSYGKRGLSYGYMGVKDNLQPDGTSDLPPPPPAPQDKGNHQHLPEDFPPPPPPLTCITMANTAARSSNTLTNSQLVECVPQHQQHYCTEAEGDGLRPRRNESNCSFKSTSSTDSGDSLPFANDNAGTIKQRSARPSFSLIESMSSSPRSSPLSSPALRRKEGIVLPTLRHPQPITTTTTSTYTTVPNTLNGCHSTMKNMSPSDGTNDVLSDIGNMLANLTDELDAMLEQELAIKNHVS